MRFKYTATTNDGRIVEGDIEADNSGEVLAFLASKDLKPISVSKIEKIKITGKDISFGKAITPMDQVFLTKHLALMLRLGTDLFKALDILIADTEKAALRSLLREIRGNLEKGRPFYETFSRYPKYFSPVFISLVKAGEASGSLVASFENLSDMLSRQEDMRRKIKSALIYPIILLVASFLILAFLTTFALPRISAVFLQGDLEVPTFSKVVFTVGLFFSDNIISLSISLIFLVVFFWYFFSRTLIGRRIFFSMLGTVPVIKGVIKKIAIQRFAGTLASLMKAGVPIIESLTITAESLGNQAMRDALLRIANEGVARGLTLGDAFKQEQSFPLSISSLVAISEKAGHLDDVLTTLSTFYESEIEISIKTLVSFIEPVLLTMIGVIVALIALSIIVPVYQLIGQF